MVINHLLTGMILQVDPYLRDFHTGYVIPLKFCGINCVFKYTLR